MSTINRYLKEDYIDLEIARDLEEPMDEDGEFHRARAMANKEIILGRLAELLERSGRVLHLRKLTQDLINRERKATTAIGNGIAIPHVRSGRVRSMAIAIGISREGVWFDSLDDEPTHLFICMVAPPSDDRGYLRVYQNIAMAFGDPGAVHEFLGLEDPGEIIRSLQRI